MVISHFIIPSVEHQALFFFLVAVDLIVFLQVNIDGSNLDQRIRCEIQLKCTH